MERCVVDTKYLEVYVRIKVKMKIKLKDEETYVRKRKHI